MILLVLKRHYVNSMVLLLCGAASLNYFTVL